MKDNFAAIYPLYGMHGATELRKLPKAIDWFGSESIDFCYITDGVKIYHPGSSDWQLLQPSETTNLDTLWGDFEKLVPPPCIYIYQHALQEAGSALALQELTTYFDAIANDVVLAIRLYKPGWFSDPKQTEVIYDDIHSAFRMRFMGPYRLTFHDDDISLSRYLLSNRYELNEKDLSTMDKKLSLAKIYDALKEHRILGQNSSVELGLRNFNASYGLAIPPAYSAVFLFSALDAMFGGMSNTRIGKVKLNLSFRERLKIALKYTSTPTFEKDANWVNNECREIRNTLSHGGTVMETAWPVIIQRLQQLIRLLLLQYLRFSIFFKGKNNYVLQLLGQEKIINYTAAYNLFLEKCGASNLFKEPLVIDEIFF